MIKSALDRYRSFYTCMFLNAKLTQLFIYAPIYLTVCTRHQVLLRIGLFISPLETLLVCILPITPTARSEPTQLLFLRIFFLPFFFLFPNLLSLVQFKKSTPNTLSCEKSS